VPALLPVTSCTVQRAKAFNTITLQEEQHQELRRYGAVTADHAKQHRESKARQQTAASCLFLPLLLSSDRAELLCWPWPSVEDLQADDTQT